MIYTRLTFAKVLDENTKLHRRYWFTCNYTHDEKWGLLYSAASL